MIRLCKNFSNVGITGWNNGTVADCFSDSSNNTGGGIVAHNYNGLVYRCFNFGSALAGIAATNSVDGKIEQCVNLGTVDGRYDYSGALWFFRNYPCHSTFAYISFAAKSALLHLPYIVRFTIFSLLFVPSTKPFEGSSAIIRVIQPSHTLVLLLKVLCCISHT